MTCVEKRDHLGKMVAGGSLTTSQISHLLLYGSLWLLLSGLSSQFLLFYPLCRNTHMNCLPTWHSIQVITAVQVCNYSQTKVSTTVCVHTMCIV